jgi:hypothetical protein
MAKSLTSYADGVYKNDFALNDFAKTSPPILTGKTVYRRCFTKSWMPCFRKKGLGGNVPVDQK